MIVWTFAVRSWDAAIQYRKGTGTDTTHWRVGTQGMTCSTRQAAVWAMRRPAHDGQNPRRLQLKASSSSWWQVSQPSPTKPCGGGCGQRARPRRRARRSSGRICRRGGRQSLERECWEACGRGGSAKSAFIFPNPFLSVRPLYRRRGKGYGGAMALWKGVPYYGRLLCPRSI